MGSVLWGPCCEVRAVERRALMFKPMRPYLFLACLVWGFTMAVAVSDDQGAAEYWGPVGTYTDGDSQGGDRLVLDRSSGRRTRQGVVSGGFPVGLFSS